MSILVFGKTGQVATELQRFKNVIAVGRDEVDLTNPDAAARYILKSDVRAVINAAAYTAVDLAQTEVALATTINSDAPKAMAQVAKQKGIPFVQISTDYVFNGQGNVAWRTTDTPAPLSAYGHSKNTSEIAIRKVGGTHAILRTSWVFSAHGSNFVKTMLRLGREREQLSIVADQIGGPTAAADIADACMKIANNLQNNPENSGTYHFCGAPNVSWADLAREIFTQADMNVRIKNIASSDYPTAAPRPLNSRLGCASTKKAFNIQQPDWRDSLAQVLQELREQDEQA